jgi:serine/threonine-protein kinase
VSGPEQSLTVGAIVGSYRTGALIGRGGMGAVYLAEHVQLRRKVALKVLPQGLARDPAFRDRFIRESQLAASIDHPNIIPVHDAGDASGVLYIAMRYVEGSDLSSVLSQDERLSPARTLAVLEQVALGLDAAHARGLVHRDVKPANILIEADTGHVFVTDFGIAKLVSATGITRTGSFLGTIEYAAPEQIEGKRVDGRTDVYSLGCVLFHCLAGQPPFRRDSEVAVMHAHLVEPPPALTPFRPELPAALDAVVARAMAKLPEDRYPTAGALVQALGEALERDPDPLSTPAGRLRAGVTAQQARDLPAGAPPPSPARRRRLWLSVAALLALVGAGIALAVVMLGGGGDGGEGNGSSRPQTAGTLRPGAPLTLAITAAGQTATARFKGKRGQRVRLAWSKNTIGGYTNVTLLTPAGPQLDQTSLSEESGELDPLRLPTSGRYQLQIDPDQANTGSITLALNTVPADAGG